MVVNRAQECLVDDRGGYQKRIVHPGRGLFQKNDPFGIGPLGRIDHVSLEPGVIIPYHPHRNDEIFYYIRAGQMMHEDMDGRIEILHPGRMMILHAGSGFSHEEGSLDDDNLEMLEIFFRPERADLSPEIRIQCLDPGRADHSWQLVAGPKGSNSPLPLRAGVWVWQAKLLDNETIQAPEVNEPSHRGLLYVISGMIEINEPRCSLQKGDQLVLHPGEKCQIYCLEKTDLVFFLLDTASTYIREGKRSR